LSPGKDSLPDAVKDGFRYRFSLPLKEKTLAEIAKRKANGEDVEAPKKKVKRMKEVYMLIKPRYYAEVSEKDLTADVDLSEDTEEMHMILQHKVR
jgi:hypothetical protein